MKTAERNTMMLLVVLTVACCLIKFVLEGVIVTLYGNTINFGHIDASVYLAILSPVLGSHSYMESKKPKVENVKQG